MSLAERLRKQPTGLKVVLLVGSLLLTAGGRGEADWRADTLAAARAYDEVGINRLYDPDDQPDELCPSASRNRQWITLALIGPGLVLPPAGWLVFGRSGTSQPG